MPQGIFKGVKKTAQKSRCNGFKIRRSIFVVLMPQGIIKGVKITTRVRVRIRTSICVILMSRDIIKGVKRTSHTTEAM